MANESKLDLAAEKIAEILKNHMEGLPLEEGKAMREEIRDLAAGSSRPLAAEEPRSISRAFKGKRENSYMPIG